MPAKKTGWDRNSALLDFSSLTGRAARKYKNVGRLIALILTVSSVIVTTAHAQVEPPDRKRLYREDTRVSKIERKNALKEALKVDQAPNNDLEFKAPEVKFDRAKNVFSGSGGVTIAQQGLQVQGEQGEFNTQTRNGHIEGEVVFSTSFLSISSDQCDFNLDSETGTFHNAHFFYEDGGYNVDAETLDKISEYKYHLDNADLTTCACSDGERPWSISANSTNITQEGYGHSYGVTFNVHGIPVFYTPYLGYPVKTERTSGLLRPQFGYSNKDGFEFEIPLFLALDDSSDLTITPFTQSRTRNGAKFDYRQAVSRKHRIKSRLIYSNESPRGDDLRGLDVSGLFDPTIDTDRFGGYYNEIWRSEPGATLPSSFVADMHYVSDDLFIREIEDSDISPYNSRFVTSSMLFQSSLTDFLSASLGSEYNQSMDGDDDLVFQRLPELRLNALKNFRPFGSNPIGLKVVTRADVNLINFYRQEGYDGTRLEMRPNVRLPFHYQNYFNAELQAGIRETLYNLDDQNLPGSETLLDDSNDRTIPELGAQISTAFERVFDLDKDSSFADVLQLGRANHTDRLVRMKHVVEPYVRYSYIPEVAGQDELPFFDSSDRIRQRSLFLLGLRTTLFGKFEDTNPTQESISELAPLVEDLPVLTYDNPLNPYDSTSIFDEQVERFRLRRGEVRELVVFNVKESYDYLEDKKDVDPNRRPWSDLGSSLEVYPNRNMRLIFEDNWDIEDHDFSSWSTALQLLDDRGDALKARYTFIDEALSQIDGNAELRLTQGMQIGYYTRFDEEASKFIEHRAGLRIKSSCNCWTMDIILRDRSNPDQRAYFVSLTLPGLGSLG